MARKIGHHDSELENPDFKIPIWGRHCHLSGWSNLKKDGNFLKGYAEDHLQGERGRFGSEFVGGRACHDWNRSATSLGVPLTSPWAHVQYATHQEHKHAITLRHAANPVSVPPYQYPQFQKDEIERLIKDMLLAGIIQPSSSAYSSLVLLPKKKDESWLFCVDYGALNKVRISFRFRVLRSYLMSFMVQLCSLSST